MSMYTDCCQVSIAANWMTDYRKWLLCEWLTFHFLRFRFFNNIRVSFALYDNAKFLLASMSRAYSSHAQATSFWPWKYCLYHLSWPCVQNTEPQSKLLVNASIKHNTKYIFFMFGFLPNYFQKLLNFNNAVLNFYWIYDATLYNISSQVNILVAKINYFNISVPLMYRV